MIDWINLPPLNSLRAFAALAEKGSFARAGASLNVTHAAVSQQVKILESRLGVPLVERSGPRVNLTPEGAALARELEIGFSVIEHAVTGAVASGASQPVRVTTSPAFAAEWLMPRVPEFQRRHPEITLMLNPTAEVIRLEPGGTDLAVRYRDASCPDPGLPPLLVSDMVVVGAPTLVGDRTSIPQLEDLADWPWLQELGTDEVGDWFRRRGVTPERPLTISQMPGNLIMQAVRRGDGITYTARAFFEREIELGEMVELHSERLGGHYLLDVRPGLERPAVTAFRRWLLAQSHTVTRL